MGLTSTVVRTCYLTVALCLAQVANKTGGFHPTLAFFAVWERGFLKPAKRMSSSLAPSNTLGLECIHCLHNGQMSIFLPPGIKRVQPDKSFFSAAIRAPFLPGVCLNKGYSLRYMTDEQRYATTQTVFWSSLALSPCPLICIQCHLLYLPDANAAPLKGAFQRPGYIFLNGIN